MEVSRAEFEALVDDALAGVPDALAERVRNVVVLIEEEPTAPVPSDTLGLYLGTPITERDSGYGFVPPDQILIYRGPLTRMCTTPEQLRDEVRITVVHEIAHHFGIDDDELHELGYG